MGEGKGPGSPEEKETSWGTEEKQRGKACRGAQGGSQGDAPPGVRFVRTSGPTSTSLLLCRPTSRSSEPTGSGWHLLPSELWKWPRQAIWFRPGPAGPATLPILCSISSRWSLIPAARVTPGSNRDSLGAGLPEAMCAGVQKPGWAPGPRSSTPTAPVCAPLLFHVGDASWSRPSSVSRSPSASARGERSPEPAGREPCGPWGCG